jgi:CheY-like chemotaxis protein
MKPHTEPSALFRALTTNAPVRALEQAHGERRLLLDRTVTAVEHERAKMAAELHDGPIQQLACFGWTLDRVVRELDRGRVDEAVELVRSVRADLTRELRTLRQMMSALRPLVLDDRGIDGPQAESGERSPAFDLAPEDKLPSVLLVDDDPTVRTVLNALLAECGFEVVGEAANGAEAVQLVEELRPDIVLMDIQMPAMNGFEAARLMRAQPQCPTIVLLSGEGHEGMDGDHRPPGVFDIVDKAGPSSAICEALGRARRSAQLERGRAA